MSTFKIDGNATREINCDIAVIEISFVEHGNNAYIVSRGVMEACDKFLEEMKIAGMEISNIQYGKDSVSESYPGKDVVTANRDVMIRIPFDMKSINLIQSILQNGKYNAELEVSGDVSNRNEISTELTMEALQQSKNLAEQLAVSLGIKVKGVDSIEHDRWDDNITLEPFRSSNDCAINQIPKTRTSDSLGTKTIKENVRLKVTWILE